MPDLDPMIKLEEGGQAPVLSYQIPDSTSYSGRHYIEIALGRDDFLGEVSVDRYGNETVETSIRPAGSRHPAGVLEGESGSIRLTRDDVMRPVGPQPMTAVLESLSDDDVAAANAAGLELHAVPNMLGTMTVSYRMIGDVDSEGDSTTPPATAKAESTEPSLTVGILTPAPSAKITGTGPSVTVAVTGTADIDLGAGSISEVEVALGSTWQKAIADASDWSDWHKDITIASSGTFHIKARANHSNGKTQATTQVTISVILTAASAGPTDTTAPTLEVTTPVSGTVVNAEEGTATIKLAGKAQDAGGVQVVRVILDGAEAMAADAVPASTGDWSTWTAEADLEGKGQHTIEVECADKAGNKSRRSLLVHVAAHAPRKWLYSRLLIAERLRFSTFLGRYGAGRVVKTFSLLPGEKTKISVRTYRRSSQTTKETSSILDHVEEGATQEVTDMLAAEQTDREAHGDSMSYNVSAKAEQSWGSGRAEVSAGISGGANASREEFAKTMTNVAQKHTAQRAAKRDIQVSNESETKAEEGEENAIEREIQNINVSRALNFVFRQMNQEFVSVLHLVDARIGYAAVFRDLVTNQKVVQYREVSIAELDSLLESVVKPQSKQKARDAIMTVLENVADYQDELHELTETVTPTKSGSPATGASYMRVRPGLKQSWEDAISETTVTVAGVVLAGTNIVMRTEGLIVDALLGQGPALDDYSIGLQEAAVEERRLRNKQLEVEVADADLRRQIVDSEDTDKADLYSALHPQRPPSLTLALNDEDNEPAPSPPTP